MNKKQKDFTIKEINKYNERINELYYGVNRSTFFSICGAAIAFIVLGMNGEFTGEPIRDNIVGVSSIASSIGNAILAIRRATEKSSLEQTVRSLEHEVAMSDLASDNNEESVKHSK